jgi:predicted GNAT family N-acyltransferase
MQAEYFARHGRPLLVDYAERFARARGWRRITMHARESTVPFYERLGYRKLGERFIEVTIPHFIMEKALKDSKDERDLKDERDGFGCR